MKKLAYDPKDYGLCIGFNVAYKHLNLGRGISDHKQIQYRKQIQVENLFLSYDLAKMNKFSAVGGP